MTRIHHTAKSGLADTKKHSPGRAVANGAIFVEVLLVLSIVAIAAYPHYSHALNLATTHRPERLTELYFPLDKPLPTTYTPGQKLTVHFAIHNLEHQDTTYPFQIALVTGTRVDIAYTHSVTVRDNQTATVNAPITIPLTANRIAVNVKLVNVQQSVHFWLGKRP